MKRKRQNLRVKLLFILLLGGSMACLGISLSNIVPYVQEEREAAALRAELSALHEGTVETLGSDNDGNWGFAESADNAGEALAMSGTVSDTDPCEENGESPDPVEGTEALATDDEIPDQEAADDETAPGSTSGTSGSHGGLAALHQKNPDCIAWITIEGTAVDYPVMYRPQSKNYYIHRDFYGRQSSSGSLYIAEICDPDTCDNLIIYGHHMSRGTMFAALDKYKKQSFYTAHPTIQLERLSGVETYEIIYVLTTPVYTKYDFKYYAFARAANAEAFNSYVANCRARALYDTGKTASYGDKLLTLSTCEYSQKNGRMVVVAKRIDP